MKLGLRFIAGTVLLAGCCSVGAYNAEFDRNVVTPFAVWKKTPPQANLPGRDKIDTILRKRQAHTDALKKFAPHILNEYDAIEREFKLKSGTYLDIAVFGLKKAPAPAPHECTSWVVMPDLTGSRTLMVHKNRDSKAKNLIAQQRAVKGKHRWIGMGNFGNLCTNMGMNDKALVVIMNSGDRTNENSDAGIGTTVMARIMLEECATAADAVKLLEKMIAEKVYTHGNSGSIWFIADKDNAFIAENNAEHVSVKSIHSGFAIRANSWDWPEMIPYSIAQPNDIVGNNRREYAVRDLLFKKYQVIGKTVTPEMMAEASRIREIPEDKKCYPLCGKLTNSAATFVIDQEFPEMLSYTQMAFGCPAYTLYLPIPLVVGALPAELLDGRNPDAAMVRWQKNQPLMDDAAMKAFEGKLNNHFRKALAAARRILRQKGDRQQATAILNNAFKENCKVFLEATR